MKSGALVLPPNLYPPWSLTSTERSYSQIEREALGCVLAVERLRNYLFGIEFTLLTANKPLSSMFDPYSSKVLQPRIQRLGWRLHQYSFRIQHIAGTASTADSMSRLPSKQNDCSIPVSFAKVMYDLFTCQICQLFQLLLFLTWDPKLAYLSGCPPKSGPASLGSPVNLPFIFCGWKGLNEEWLKSS